MKQFKGIYPYGRSWLHFYGNSKIGHNIAHTLYDFGVTNVKPSVHFLAGHEDTDHLNLWLTSFICEPYIKVLTGKVERPLLWAILDELKIKFSGGCGERYMQASFSDSGLEGYRVKHSSASDLISSICLHFNAIKEFKNVE